MNLMALAFLVGLKTNLTTDLETRVNHAWIAPLSDFHKKHIKECSKNYLQ
jgi:hypothetical protein